MNTNDDGSSHNDHDDGHDHGFHDQALIPYVPFYESHHYRLYRSLHQQQQKRKQQQQQQQQTTAANNDNNKNDATATSIMLLDDIIPNILSYCDAKTLSGASCVCRSWNTIAKSNEFWEHLCKQRFGVSAYQIKPSPDPIKNLYILSHRRLMEAVYYNHRNDNHRDLLGRGLSTLPRFIPALAASL